MKNNEEKPCKTAIAFGGHQTHVYDCEGKCSFCTCPCHHSPSPDESWEARIEEIIAPVERIDRGFLRPKLIELAHTIEERARADALKNVGMLRQWLNEDRIKDADNFVTNEDIIHFLTFTLKHPQK